VVSVENWLVVNEFAGRTSECQQSTARISRIWLLAHRPARVCTATAIFALAKVEGYNTLRNMSMMVELVSFPSF
jgi:hypothetical protein